MLPLLIAQQIREADAYTIAHEPVSSINLMERAAKAFVGWFVNHFPDKKHIISVYCGTGNNGGDGLAIARILCDHGYCHLTVKIVRFTEKASDDFKVNLQRLKKTNMVIHELKPQSKLFEEKAGLIIDAILGSGLNKPLAGGYKKLVEYLNNLLKTVVAVDVPTGFYTDGEIPKEAIVLKAGLVITFQQPKLNFLLPESAPYIACWEAVKIGLNEDFIKSVDTPYFFVEEGDVRKMIKPRHKFSNKGTYGHALVAAGKDETMGAALLSAAACAYTGAGLTTACIPKSGLTALNSYMPELMAIIRDKNKVPDVEWDKFSAVGIGPGLGKDAAALKLLKTVFRNYKKPVVIDADGLNLLAENKQLLKKISGGSILTPHMKEFDRLFGHHTSWWQRLQTARKLAITYNINIILKNDYTITATAGGKLYFNCTSNAAMASGGMGDVLTGIITSLLAQGYTPQDACIAGVYIHGKAGDELAMPNRMHVVMPGKIISQLPLTMAKLRA